MIAAALCLFAGLVGIVTVGAVILVVFAALDGLDDLPDFDDDNAARPLADMARRHEHTSRRARCRR